MATSNGFLHSDPPSASPMLPPWLSNSNGSSTVGPPSPSVALTLSPAMGPIPWLQPERTDNGLGLGNLHSLVSNAETLMVSELAECCRELEEGHRLWVAHKKETAWRLKRVELQLESEKANRRREKMEEIELKVRALREEQKASLEMIDAEYKEQILGLKRDAEVKEQKLVEQWAARHARLVQFLEQMGCRQRRVTEQTGK